MIDFRKQWVRKIILGNSFQSVKDLGEKNPEMTKMIKIAKRNFKTAVLNIS